MQQYNIHVTCREASILAGKTLADIMLMRFNKVTVEIGVETALWPVE